MVNAPNFCQHTFQNAKIVTIDLPDDEENFQETYGRKKGVGEISNLSATKI